MKWVTFFSQTGSEIVEVCKKLKRWPDKICTNKSITDIDTINQELLNNCFDKIFFLPAKPRIEEYSTGLRGVVSADIITLHGYLRIIPSAVCNMYTIYNGHPGDIVNHPELKGFNPQKKAFDLKIRTTGSVIHVVNAKVDDGPIVATKQCKISLTSFDKACESLHKNSISLWVEFLRNEFKIKL